MRKLLIRAATPLFLAIATSGAAHARSSDPPEPYSDTNPSTTVQPNAGSTEASADEAEDGEGFDWGLLGLLGLAGLLGQRRRDRR